MMGERQFETYTTKLVRNALGEGTKITGGVMEPISRGFEPVLVYLAERVRTKVSGELSDRFRNAGVYHRKLLHRRRLAWS